MIEKKSKESFNESPNHKKTEQTVKVLIINGSPSQERGATGAVIGLLEKGLQKVDPEITKKNVYSLNIKPCRGCFSCWQQTPGKCVYKDDMRELLALADEADILVFATPIYVDGMTGPMKIMVDRMIPLIKGSVELRDDHMRHVPRSMENKKLVLISASGFTELDNFDPLVAHVRAIAKNLNREYAGEILVPSAWFIPHMQPVYERVAEIIVNAGEELVEKGSISPEVSGMIASMVPREHVMAAMNYMYNQFE